MRLRIALATTAAASLLAGPAAVATVRTSSAPTVALGGLRAAPGWSLSQVGHQSVLTPLPGAGATAASLATGAVQQRRFARIVLRGTPGTTVQLVAGTATSAAIALDSSWQAAGISVPAGTTSIRLVRAGFTSSPIEIRAATTTNSPRSVTGVRKGTRMITLNGRPFTVRGYTYMQYPIGTNPDQPSMEPAACQRDARLMGPAGVDLVRIGWEDQASVAEVQDYLKCADAFYANHIGVVWIVGPPSQGQYAIDQPATPVPAPNAFVEATWLAVDNAIKVVGDHPATYMWQVGNEVERWNNGEGRAIWLGDKSTGKVGALEAIAERIHETNPGHIVGTSIAEGYQDWIARSVVPSLDFWALTLFNNARYPSPKHMNGLHHWDTRPMFAVEMGADRYRCARGSTWIDSNGQSIAPSCAQTLNGGSYEDQAAQAQFDIWAWRTIRRNLATPSNPQGLLSGGLVFTFNDIWWFTLTNLTPSSALTHEVYGGSSYPVEPDAIFDGEWTGVAAAQLPHATSIRTTSLAFDAMEQIWTGHPLPKLEDVSVQVASATPGCTAVVRWRTTSSMSSEVQGGATEVVVQDGEIVQDNTKYTMSQTAPKFTSTHVIRLRLPLPGDYRVIARSFTQGGKSVTTQPLAVSCS